MQDNDNRFDLLVRSAMENATEEVPSRVWDSIEGRLPGRRTAPVWGWSAGLVGALAVALALVFVLRTPSGNSTVQIAPSGEPAVAEVPATAPSNLDHGVIAPATEAVAAATAATAPGAAKPAERTAQAAAQPQGGATGAEAQPEAAESAAPAEAARAAAKPAEQKPREEQRAPEAVKPLWESAYAEFAEPAKTARRASLDLKGMLGSNDKVSGGFNPFNGYYGAPGQNPVPKQGISEGSESIYGIPVTFGLGVRFPLAGRFSIGTGLDYSFLTRTFTGSFVDAAGAVKPGLELVNNLYYIGIPVNLYYNIVDSGRLRLYGFAGGEVEKGVASSFRARNADFVYRESVPGLQWSVDAGLGVQYMILDRVGVFFDPSARYYFDCGQPKSVRTQKPFLFNLEAGFRFDL